MTGPSLEVLVLVAFLAFLAEYVDSSLGMGYGTSLTPALLLLGFAPLHVIPLVLLSEFLTGLLAGGFHHAFRNVDFSRGSRHLRVAGVLTACSLVGVGISVLVAVQLPESVLMAYIGAMVLAVGLLILATANRVFRFSWPRLTAVGLVAAFNKGMSGGGYGPVATGGQILTGVETKSAIGITSLSEGMTSLAGFLLFLAVGVVTDLTLAVPLLLGGVLSVPVATYTVKRAPMRFLRVIVGVAIVVLGLLVVARLAL